MNSLEERSGFLPLKIAHDSSIPQGVNSGETMPLCTFLRHTDILQLSYEQWQLQCYPGLLQITVPPEYVPLQPSQSNLNKYKNPKMFPLAGYVGENRTYQHQLIRPALF